MTLSAPSRRTLLVAALATAAPIALPENAFAAVTASGWDGARGCVYAGTRYYAPASSKIAPGPHCFATPDDLRTPRLGTVVGTRTAAQLRQVEAASPLRAFAYLPQGSFAQRDVRRAPRTKLPAGLLNRLADSHNPYGVRVSLNGGGHDHLRKDAPVGAKDNVPVYTVDSSNPNQTFTTMTSRGPRVVDHPGVKHMCTGRIPLPTWAKSSEGGDHSFAVYDCATGIWRAYFGATKIDARTWDCAAAGYMYFDPQGRGVNLARNFWLCHVQGSNTVTGVATSLLQIGRDELKRGAITHALSMTLPEYLPGASFPGKQSDGALSESAWKGMTRVGQMLALPTSLDVDAYCASRGLSEEMRAVMRAAQTYGIFPADRNRFCFALNLESPLSMAEAREGRNGWRTDAAASAAVDRLASDINRFPLDLLEAAPRHWAGDALPSVISPFRDVTEKTRYAKEIVAIGRRGIFRGTSNGVFRPTAALTRDLAIASLYRAAGSPAVTPPATSPFVDVPRTHAYYREICWAHQKKITLGWSGAKGREFRPTATVTRGAMADLLYRTATGRTSAARPASAPFRDVPVTHGLAGQIAWVKAKRISTGYSDGTYRPLAGMLRQDLALFLENARTVLGR